MEKLPLLAGKLLERLRIIPITSYDDETLIQRVEADQRQRTYDRKAAQIARSAKDKKPRKGQR